MYLDCQNRPMFKSYKVRKDSVNSSWKTFQQSSRRSSVLNYCSSFSHRFTSSQTEPEYQILNRYFHPDLSEIISVCVKLAAFSPSNPFQSVCLKCFFRKVYSCIFLVLLNFPMLKSGSEKRNKLFWRHHKLVTQNLSNDLYACLFFICQGLLFLAKYFRSVLPCRWIEQCLVLSVYMHLWITS